MSCRMWNKKNVPCDLFIRLGRFPQFFAIIVLSLMLLMVSLSPVKSAQETEKGILLNFRNTPVETVLGYLSEVAGLVVVSEADLKDRITVISRKPLELEEAISLINTILKEHGYTAIRTGRTLKIALLSEAKKMSIPVRSGSNPNEITPSDDVITYIVPVKYANAVNLKDNLSSLISKDADFTANGDTNTLIITDTAANIRRLVEIVNAIDTHMAAVAEIRVFHLEYADAESTAELINEIFEEQSLTGQATSGVSRMQSIIQMMRSGGPRGELQGQSQQTSQSGGSAAAVNITAKADERTNSVVVSAPLDSIDVIETLIIDLDSDSSEGQSVFVYPLKNARAENLQEVLTNLFSEIEETTAQNIGAAAQRAQGQQGSVPVGPGAIAFAQASTESSSTGDLEGQVSIQADEDTNSLIIMTSAANYQKVKRILDELDKPVPQVLIKVLLAEVTHDGSVDLGTEFSYLNEWKEEGSIAMDTDFGIGDQSTGYVAKVIDEKFDLKLRALEQEGKLNILSRPYILASNNQKATITVGSEVPFIRDTRTTETGQTINTIEYEDIGIILEVTPYINDEGLVIMDLSQEISAISGNSVPISETVNASVFAKRASENRIIARNGQTVVIGGLMEDRQTDTVNKVPLLGDIPLLGLLFSRVEKENSKTELLIFLTPTVAATDKELMAISEEKKAESRLIQGSLPQDDLEN